MGNQHDSLALLLMELMENIHDFPSGNGIESAGGFVCQDDGRVVGIRIFIGIPGILGVLQTILRIRNGILIPKTLGSFPGSSVSNSSASPISSFFSNSSDCSKSLPNSFTFFFHSFTLHPPS